MANPTITDHKETPVPTDLSEQDKQKNKAAIALLDKWLADESGYDEKTWPVVKQALQEGRSSGRKLFDE